MRAVTSRHQTRLLLQRSKQPWENGMLLQAVLTRNSLLFRMECRTGRTSKSNLQRRERLHRGCASYKPASSRVYYGETFMKAAQVLSTGTTILAHELGHALGLLDGGTNPNPPSIMNNPSNSLPGGCTAPVVPTTTVQSGDATTIPVCTRAARTKLNLQNANEHRAVQYNTTTPYSYYTYTPVCTYTYYTENFYVDGEFDSSSQYLYGVSCS